MEPADPRKPDLEPSGRELGRITGAQAGPTVVAIAGLHGNEPAGLVAVLRVLGRLGGLAAPPVGPAPGMRGELLALAGNVGALRAGIRYRSQDLNRAWTDERAELLRALGGVGAPLDAEDAEQRELTGALEAARDRARGPLVLLDLHSSSAGGFPFVIFGDTPAQRRFVEVFPLPLLLGFEAFVLGCVTAFWARRGFLSCTVEGGQHEDPATVDHLEAALWLGLGQAGALDPGLPELVLARDRLAVRSREAPRRVQVLSRHPVVPGDGFRMEPGLRNIERARAGQLLATDARGQIRAPTDGVVMLPLYQGQGADGFFWGIDLEGEETRPTPPAMVPDGPSP